MFKKLVCVTMVAALLGIAGSAFAAEQFKAEYKMSTNVSEITPPGKAVAYFAAPGRYRTIYRKGGIFPL